jgi:hypothetical protein
MTKKQIRIELWNRQRGRCFWCGELIPSGDIGLADIGRVTPKSAGGTFEMPNLILLHARCTQRRYGIGRARADETTNAT